MKIYSNSRHNTGDIIGPGVLHNLTPINVYKVNNIAELDMTHIDKRLLIFDMSSMTMYYFNLNRNQWLNWYTNKTMKQRQIINYSSHLSITMMEFDNSSLFIGNFDYTKFNTLQNFEIDWYIKTTSTGTIFYGGKQYPQNPRENHEFAVKINSNGKLICEYPTLESLHAINDGNLHHCCICQKDSKCQLIIDSQIQDITIFKNFNPDNTHLYIGSNFNTDYFYGYIGMIRIQLNSNRYYANYDLTPNYQISPEYNMFILDSIADNVGNYTIENYDGQVTFLNINFDFFLQPSIYGSIVHFNIIKNDNIILLPLNFSYDVELSANNPFYLIPYFSTINGNNKMLIDRPATLYATNNEFFINWK